jgi:hypothetical protein
MKYSASVMTNKRLSLEFCLLLLCIFSFLFSRAIKTASLVICWLKNEKKQSKSSINQMHIPENPVSVLAGSQQQVSICDPWRQN